MLFLGTVLVLLSLASAQDPPDYDWDTITRLDEYVHEDDGFWSYELLETYPLDGMNVYILNMTSQQWIGEEWVDRHIWFHHVIIAIPDELRDTTAALQILGSGNNDNPVPDLDHQMTQMAISYAEATKTVTSVCMHIMNQPAVFANDPNQIERIEESWIAWTWRTAIDDPDESSDWLSRLPMTKAAKRALDTTHAFTQEVRPETDLTRFGVSGPSLRGWTTWSLAATDQRVIMAAPIVFSMMNIQETYMAHYQAMEGAWSFAFRGFWEEGITYHLLDEVEHLYDVEDMIRYRSRLTMPILMMSASGDELFLNQDSHTWWDMMPGPKYMMMVPNANHLAMVGTQEEIFSSVCGFWISILDDVALPEISWTRSQDDNGGQITLSTDTQPSDVTGFLAQTMIDDNRRDFRIFAGAPPRPHPVEWSSDGQNVEDDGDGNFVYEVEQVEDEWVGHFIEVRFDGPEGFTMTFGSEVNIAPDTFPAEPCETAEECYGYLV